MTETPKFITSKILELCEEVNRSARPTFVRITAEPDCEPDDCFLSVRRKVEAEGGRIQYGWAIWEWPGVYVEAEHHAVYEPRSGQPWVDITPPASPEIKRRLFLPDDNAIYDFENEGVRRDNIRLAVADDPQIQEFFRSAAKRNEILNRIPGVGAVAVDIEDAKQLHQTEQRIADLTLDLAMKYTRRNERCFCGSRKKFKYCHGSVFE